MMCAYAGRGAHGGGIPATRGSSGVVGVELEQQLRDQRALPGRAATARRIGRCQLGGIDDVCLATQDDLRVRGLRPQGVGSGGFNSLGLHWFLFALLMLLLAKLHDVSLVLADTKTKEAHMNNDQINSTSNTYRFCISLIDTMWAIGTSVAAGALSA
jgi:hypothetical protein